MGCLKMQTIQLGAALIFAGALGLGAAGAGSQTAAPSPLLLEVNYVQRCEVAAGPTCTSSRDLVLEAPYVYCRHEVSSNPNMPSHWAGHRIEPKSPNVLVYSAWARGELPESDAPPKVLEQEVRLVGIKSYANDEIRRALGCVPAV